MRRFRVISGQEETVLQSGSARFRLTRRAVLAGAIGQTALFAAPALAQQDKPISFGLTPVFLDNDLELLDALQAYLRQATGHPIELVSRRTYQEVTALLVSGQLDAAWICGYPYIQFRDELELVAVPEWNGKPLYQSYIIVGASRQVESVADLKDDIHAFSDPDSNSGYLVTRALLHELGTSPDRFFRKTMFTYGHRNVIRAVGSGLAQSGSVDGYVWEVMRELEPDLVERTNVIRKSEWLGFPPIATSRQYFGKPAIKALKRSFLAMHASEQGRHVLRLLKLTSFADPDEKWFDGIAAKVAALRGEL